MATRSRIGTLIFGLLLVSPVGAQAIQRVSVATGGAQANDDAQRCSISADGRYVAFRSSATNLVPGDTNGVDDIFVHDRQTGTTVAASVDSNEVLSDGYSTEANLSGDGRYVVFQSHGTNLVPGDLSGDDLFLRDIQSGTTEQVNLNSSGVRANNLSYMPAVSGDGRYVAFHSLASNLVPGDTNGVQDVFVRDRQLGTTERVSVAWDGSQLQGWWSFWAVITPDGRHVAFQSLAANVVPGGASGQREIYVRDRLLGTNEHVTVDSNEQPVDGFVDYFAISADGRFIAFSHTANDLVSGDTNYHADTFVRDRTAGTTELVSVNSGEGQSVGRCRGASISADGRFVAFHSKGNSLVTGDTNGANDVFVRDRQLGTTERLSLSAGGAEGYGVSELPVISPDGRWVAFESFVPTLVAGDTNGVTDIFVRDREAASFASMCDAGHGGVAPCPCSNPRSGTTRGCDNSAATGGAALSASGATHLSADSLVFTTSGEKPTALSIVLQGSAFLSQGIVYGQGIRCVGGSLKRLYAKSAVGGSITAPDFGAGDPSVSARSAAKGDVIQPGQPRWYMVYYRDNTVLGGCPASSTFNTTQTGMVSWAP